MLPFFYRIETKLFYTDKYNKRLEKDLIQNQYPFILIWRVGQKNSSQVEPFFIHFMCFIVKLLEVPYPFSEHNGCNFYFLFHQHT